MTDLTWTDQFYDNYTVLKSLRARVPPNLLPLYNSLIKQAQAIDHGIQTGDWFFGNTRDAVTNFFDQARRFAQRMGTISADAVPPWDLSRTAADDVGDVTTGAVSHAANAVEQFEAEVERLLIWGAVLLGAYLVMPAMLRVVGGRR